MQTRKHTAWKKNRKLGDVMGGRMRPKLADNNFRRFHNLEPPVAEEETPIFIVENPSKDFYYPATVDEIKTTLRLLPVEHTQLLTHVWLQKVKKQDSLSGETVQGEFICGSNVYLIKLYAVPKDNKMRFGLDKPSQKQLGFYQPYCLDLQHNKQGWFLQWTQENWKRYFLEKLLLHEIGHCVDWVYHRHWSKANTKAVEDFANHYAIRWSTKINANS